MLDYRTGPRPGSPDYEALIASLGPSQRRGYEYLQSGATGGLPALPNDTTLRDSTSVSVEKRVVNHEDITVTPGTDGVIPPLPGKVSMVREEAVWNPDWDIGLNLPALPDYTLEALGSVAAGLPTPMRQNIAPQGGGGLVSATRFLVPFALKMLLSSFRQSPIRTGLSLFATSSIISNLVGMLGKSPRNFLEDAGFTDVEAALGADFLEFMERAVQEGMLAFPETPQGYEEGSYREGLNYLHINMRTGKMWLTDKVSVGRYNRWRD